MTEPRRRRFLTEPGEPLLMTTDPTVYIRRFDEFIEASGLAPERVLGSPVVAVPIPVARRDADGRPKRWADARPQVMWHPLMWLPQHLALRYRYRTIDPEQGGNASDFEIESDSIWAIRVALGLVSAGLYDQESGTWTDVLSLHGLDIDDPAVLDRVGRWQSGEPDEALDAIDLSPLVPGADDPSGTIAAARDVADRLVPAQWSITASALLNVIVEGTQTDTDEISMRQLVSMVGRVAASALHEVPPDPDEDEDVMQGIGMIAEAATSETTEVRVLVDALAELLSKIAEDYAPAVKELNEWAAE